MLALALAGSSSSAPVAVGVASSLLRKLLVGGLALVALVLVVFLLTQIREAYVKDGWGGGGGVVCVSTSWRSSMWI